MLDKINNFLFPIIISVLCCSGVYLTYKLRFFQVKHLKSILKAPISFDCKSGISSFSAMSTALAGTLGVGNIIGVATAICMGGPGAVFYMMVSAFFGMATKCVEICLSLLYKEKHNGKSIGGPMFYLKNAEKTGIFSVLFCISCILSATIGSGNISQAGCASKNLIETFNINPWIISISFTLLTLYLIKGGIKKISSFMQILTPVISIAFIVSMLIIIFKYQNNLSNVIASIFKNAFNFKSFFGGTAGYSVSMAIRYGISRGVFSNEAGLGSSPIIYGATGGNPVKQGLCGAFEVFADTIIIAFLTALVILLDGNFTVGESGGMSLVNEIYGRFYGFGGSIFVSVIISLFAISTVPGWFYYGERSVAYLSKESKKAKNLYTLFFLVCVFLSSFISVDKIFPLADLCNYFMIIINSFGVLKLSGKAIKAINNYYNNSIKIKSKK